MAGTRRVVDDAVGVRDTRPVRKLARLGEQSGVVANAFEKPGALTRDPVHVRRVDERMAGDAHLVPAHVVHEHHDDVRTTRRGQVRPHAVETMRCADRQQWGKSMHRASHGAAYYPGNRERLVTSRRPARAACRVSGDRGAQARTSHPSSVRPNSHILTRKTPSARANATDRSVNVARMTFSSSWNPRASSPSCPHRRRLVKKLSADDRSIPYRRPTFSA